MTWALTPEQREALARALELARDMRAAGATLKVIAERLTADGYPTRRSIPWGYRDVWQLLNEPLPAGHSPEYGPRHRRVEKARGKAKGYPCIWCGKPAVHWATIHGTDGTKPEDYQPMCQPCHLVYDGITGNPRSDEMRAKMRAYASAMPAEHRANLSKALQGRAGGMTGKRHSEETRRKMSETARAREARRRSPDTARGADEPLSLERARAYARALQLAAGGRWCKGHGRHSLREGHRLPRPSPEGLQGPGRQEGSARPRAGDGV